MACRAHMGRKGEPTAVEDTPPPPPSTEELIPLLLLRRFAVVSYSVSVSPSSSSSSSYKNTSCVPIGRRYSVLQSIHSARLSFQSEGKGQTLWYFRSNIIPLRSVDSVLFSYRAAFKLNLV